MTKWCSHDATSRDITSYNELYKDFLKRVKKQMKKHYEEEEYVNLVPIRYGEDGFFFEIHEASKHFVHNYRMVMDEPNPVLR